MSTRRTRKRIGVRDRLGQLTYRGACRLLGDDDDAPAMLREGGQFAIDLDEDVYLGGDTFRVTVADAEMPDGVARVNVVEMTTALQGLHLRCDRCEGRCVHVAAALSLVLESKLPLGLSAPPDPSEPIELLTEEELVRRALADREERAQKEKMRLQSAEPGQPWTDYVLTSYESGKSYRVSLRGFESGQSYCSCPDFRTNHLGTCKHILHAQAKVRKRFPNKVLEKPYRRKNFSVRVDYGPQVGLRFNLPAKVPPAAARVLGPIADHATQNAAQVVRCIRKLEQAGHEVHVYPDAEEFIETRLKQDRLATTAAEIRQNPTDHPLRTELLAAELLPYQLDGIAFAVGAGRAILADDMGLGKTIQGIGTAELLARLVDIRRVLVVCPASVKSQWRNEVQRFCDRSVQLVIGSAEERVDQYESDAFFTICNYEQILRDHSTVERIPWDLIILDEGQRIKNWEAKTSRVMKSLHSPFALVLSGTPLENRLEELYSVMGFIDDRRLGPAYRFLHRHRLVDDRGRVLGYRKLNELRSALAPVLLRRTRQDVMRELPERTTEIVRIRPTEEQADLSAGHLRTVAQIVRKAYITEMDLLRMQKHLLMARLAADSTYLIDKQPPGFSSKLERLEELLEQLAGEPERKIVLFSEWKRMLSLIEPLLDKLDMQYVRLDGGVPQKQRQRLVHRFQNDSDCRLIMMTNAGATGLNLQAADTVINVDLPWNPAVLEQRVARAHRMGQTRPVHVYVLVTEDTIEERLLATLSAKHDLALAALDMDSDVDAVELQAGIDELKRRLERLLGDKPDAPIDKSQQLAVEAEVQRQRNARQQKVAAAGGEVLGAALKMVSELLGAEQAAPSAAVDQIRSSLNECVEKDDQGIHLRVTLPGDDALDALATSLAKLLAAGRDSG